jgi:hypothetical protein
MGRKISDMTPAEQEAQREKWKIAARASRKNKKKQGQLFDGENQANIKKKPKVKLTEKQRLERKRKSHRKWLRKNRHQQAKYLKEKKRKKTEEWLKKFKEKYG